MHCFNGGVGGELGGGDGGDLTGGEFDINKSHGASAAMLVREQDGTKARAGLGGLSVDTLVSASLALCTTNTKLCNTYLASPIDINSGSGTWQIS